MNIQEPMITPFARTPGFHPMHRLQDMYTIFRDVVLGKGEYSTVYRGVSVPQFVGEEIIQVAAKVVHKENAKTMKQELQALLLGNGIEGVVHFYDLFVEEHSFTIILECMEGGQLLDLIIKQGTYCERDASRHIGMVANTLNQLHINNVVHRDLKPQNLLLNIQDTTAIVKIADFGFSKVMDASNPEMTTRCGTIAYCAPEILGTNKAYSSKVDSWSLGIILFIILGGYHPFDPMNECDDERIMQRILTKNSWNFNATCWSYISNEAKDLISKLIEWDPEKRLSCQEVTQHPWVLYFQQNTETGLNGYSRQSLLSFSSLEFINVDSKDLELL